MRPFIISHEHPHRLKPLLQELEMRGIPYQTENQVRHHFALEERTPRYAIFYNRMSPSAYLRNGIQGSFYTLNYLKHLENHGIRVINGSRAFIYETSKALQLILLQNLGISYPKTHVINHPSELEAACKGLQFPILIKTNLGSDNNDHKKFNSIEEIDEAIANNQIDMGIDHTVLVQEFIPARGGYITRVETLGGKYIYALRIYNNGQETESYDPPASVIRNTEAIVQNAGIDIGGTEYIIDDRNGELLYYALNTSPDFIDDAANLAGINPTARLVDFLEHEAIRQTDDIAVV